MCCCLLMSSKLIDSSQTFLVFTTWYIAFVQLLMFLQMCSVHGVRQSPLLLELRWKRRRTEKKNSSRRSPADLHDQYHPFCIPYRTDTRMCLYLGWPETSIDGRQLAGSYSSLENPLRHSCRQVSQGKKVAQIQAQSEIPYHVLPCLTCLSAQRGCTVSQRDLTLDDFDSRFLWQDPQCWTVE